MSKQIGLKIFDDINSVPFFLFHGLNKTRKVPINEWIKADTRLVRDGSGKAKYYISGFHVMTSQVEIDKLSRRFKNLDNRVIAKVHYKGTRKKEHSPHNIVLADHMCLKKEDWDNRISIRRL